MLTCNSFFSGIGGFDLGFERAGIRTLAQVEFDEKCRAVLARHFPDADRSITDIRHANSDNLPTADVWCGGFPCQDLSVAGKRQGLAGERSGLWYEFHRAIVSAKPRWVVIENVPGLLSSNDGRDFAILLGGLTGRIPAVPGDGWGNAGFVRGSLYSVAYRVLDAQFFGVAQRRRRVFIVGSLGDGRAAEVLFEREGGPGDTAPRRQAGERVAGTTDASAYSDSGPGWWRHGIGTLRAEGENRPSRPSNIIAWDNGQGDPNADEDGTAFALNAQANQGVALTFESRFARNGRGAPSEIVAPLKAESGQTGKGDGAPLVFQPRFYSDRVRMGGEPSEVCHTLSADAAEGDSAPHVVTHTLRAEGHDASEDGTGRGVPLAVCGVAENQRGELSLTEYAHQLTAGGGKPGKGYSAAMTGMGVRRLMPVECERLQSFPDGWTDNQADSARYRQLGNAVCVNVATWIGRRIVEAA